MERAKQHTYKKDKFFHVQYVRFADDLVVLIDGHHSWANLPNQVLKRLGEEFEKIGVRVNSEKTKTVDLLNKDTFSFPGFKFYRTKTIKGEYAPKFSPTMKSRNKLVDKISQELKHMRSWPVQMVIEKLNPILRGWVNYFRIGHSSQSFGQVKDWVEMKVRRHLSRACKRKGVGWDRWSKTVLYKILGLYDDYHIEYAALKVIPAQQAP
jgi:RNA-directed DNA polymerase